MKTMRFLSWLWLLLAASMAVGAERITVFVDFNTNPADGNSLTLNSDTRTWRNSVTTPATEVLIGGTQGDSQTNLFEHVNTYGFPGPVIVQQTGTGIKLVGQVNQAMDASVNTAWATLTFVTNQVTQMVTIRVPVGGEPNTNVRTNNASELVAAIELYSTNAFSAGITALQNYVHKQGNTITDAFILTNGSTVWNFLSTPNSNTVARLSDLGLSSAFAADQFATDAGTVFIKDGAVLTNLMIRAATMTDFLTLNADPVNALHAATKQFVEAQIAGGSSPTGPAGGELSGNYPNPTLLNSAVIGKVLTGLSTSTGGPVVAADSILVAFGRLENRMALNDAKVTGADRISNSIPVVTIGNHASLSAERALAANTGLQLSDGGPNTSVAVQIAPSAAGNGLGYSSGVLSLNTGTGFTLTADSLRYDLPALTQKASAVVGDHLLLYDSVGLDHKKVLVGALPFGLNSETFLTTSGAVSLSAERILSAGAGLASTDGGPNGSFTIDVGAGEGILVSADQVSLGIDVLTAETSVDQAVDVVAIFDNSAGAHRKVTVTNLLGGLPTNLSGEPYAVIGGLSSNLSAERQLAPGPGMVAVDNGPNNTFTLGLNATTAGNGLTFLSSKYDVGQGPGLAVTADTVELDVNSLVTATGSVQPASDTVPIYDASALGTRKVTVQSLTADKASSAEPFLTVGGGASLTGERAIIAGNGLGSTDGGANGNYTLAVNTGVGIVINSDNVGMDIFGLTSAPFSPVTDEIAFYDSDSAIIRKATGDTIMAGRVKTSATVYTWAADATLTNDKVLSFGNGLQALDLDAENRELSVKHGDGLTIGGGGTLQASIVGLTTEVTPDGAADYVMIHDASVPGLRKVLLNDLPSTGASDTDDWNLTGNAAIGGSAFLGTTDSEALRLAQNGGIFLRAFGSVGTGAHLEINSASANSWSGSQNSTMIGSNTSTNLNVAAATIISSGNSRVENEPAVIAGSAFAISDNMRGSFIGASENVRIINTGSASQRGRVSIIGSKDSFSTNSASSVILSGLSSELIGTNSLVVGEAVTNKASRAIAMGKSINNTAADVFIYSDGSLGAYSPPSAQTFNVVAANGVVINNGTGVKRLISNTSLLDFDLTSAVSHDLTITVTGAQVGDTVAIGVPNGSVTTHTMFWGWVSAADTVTVRAMRLGSGVNPASGNFRATVTRF